MVNTNKEWLSMSDKSIIETIGNYIKKQRLQQNKTQATIAEHAGINRWTMSKIENGEAISLSSLIQILRALDLLQILDVFVVESKPSPLLIAKLEKKERKRASSKNESENQNESEW